MIRLVLDSRNNYIGRRGGCTRIGQQLGITMDMGVAVSILTAHNAKLITFQSEYWLDDFSAAHLLNGGIDIG